MLGAVIAAFGGESEGPYGRGKVDLGIPFFGFRVDDRVHGAL